MNIVFSTDDERNVDQVDSKEEKNDKDDTDTGNLAESSFPMILTASTDRCVLLWSLDAVLVGQFGGAFGWELSDRLSWVGLQSANLLGIEDKVVGDEEDTNTAEDLLAELDERLQKRSSPQKLTIMTAELTELPPQTMMYG